MTNNITLLMWGYFAIAVVLLITVLNIIQKLRKNKYKKIVEKLEKEKNLITNVPILQELSRVELILKTEELGERFKGWNNKYNEIKEKKLPKISDMLLEADYLIDQKDYKNFEYKIVKTEIEIYKVREKADFLLNEIRKITLSEEKNRNIITKLKAKYRELSYEFKQRINEYGETAKSIELQFENIEKRFLEFEKNMENNDYGEVNKIIGALDEMINHMDTVIKEVPDIILMVNMIIPKKMKEASEIYNKMVTNGYQLDYLKFDYNVEETHKKISNLIDRIKVLNLENATLEAKVIFEYYDSLFSTFDSEKTNKEKYEENFKIFKAKLRKVNGVMEEIYAQLDELTENFDINDEKLKELEGLKDKLLDINLQYKELETKNKIKIQSYRDVSKQLQNLNYEITKVEETLKKYLDSIGNMKEDEKRAKEQLEEIITILKKCKIKVRKYKLPTIPKEYHVQMKEANESIEHLVKELEKNQLNIKTLNTRVDTARDLVFKLNNTTNEMIKNALMAEKIIVYGNRYKSHIPAIEQGLNNAELLFKKGNYKTSLETSVNSIDLVEPGIYTRIQEAFKDEAI